MKSLIFISLVFLEIPQEKCEHLWNQQLPELHLTNPDDVIVEKNSKELQIRGLEGTLHYDTLLNLRHVSKLKIINNRLREIEPGAVCSPHELKSLELNFAANPQAPPLTKHVFRQCHLQLEELFLRFDFDNPSVLEEDALEDLNLRTLGLQLYNIGNLHKDFLKIKKTNLTKLLLVNCGITDIEADMFHDLENLQEVEISYNKNLEEIPKDLFIKTVKLKRLFLKFNGLKDLNWDEFDGLKFLEELDLSGNRLIYFDAKKISESMPRLKKMSIFKNMCPCKLKERFAENLRAHLNRSVEVSYNTYGCTRYVLEYS